MNFEKIGIAIMERRRQLGLRQEDLSEMSGITARTIHNIEAGKGNASFSTLRQLCEVLGMEILIQIKKAN